jgi:hypothetical protein
MDYTVYSVALNTPDHGGTGNIIFKQEFDDGLMGTLAFVCIIFTKVNYHPMNRVASCFILFPKENKSTGSPRSSYGASNTYQILLI